MTTRRDWWIGVGLIVLALLIHALVPRYAFHAVGGQGFVIWRVDHWRGTAEWSSTQRDAVWSRPTLNEFSNASQAVNPQP